MWSLKSHWYEIVFRAICVFTFLFVTIRFWGRKHFGELSPFDLLILLIISEAVQNGLGSDEKSLSGSFISVFTLISLNALMGKLAFHYPKLEKIFDGEAKHIIKDGIIDEKLREKETLTSNELKEALRMQGVDSPNDVALGTIETNGKITVIKKEKS